MGLGLMELLVLGVLFLGVIGAIAVIVIVVNRSSSGRSEDRYRPD